MANNFNLRQFSTENKLTKNTKLLNEAQFSDSYDSPAAKKVHRQLRSIVDIFEKSYNEEVAELDAAIAAAEKETGTQVTPTERRVLQQQAQWIRTHDTEMEREGTENKKPIMKESKLTAKERRLVEMVNNAMGFSEGEKNVDYTMGRQDDPNQLPNPAPELNIPEGEEMVNEKPMPKYESIEKLMQEIDKSTDEAAHKHKEKEMKRVADMLEKKCTALEEGEDSDFRDEKKLKQLKKDAMTLRKGIEKMEKLGEKKFTKKQTKETKAELKETKMENTFDLRKFLVENKLTNSSKMLAEQTQYKDGDTVDIEGDDWRVYKAFSGNKDNMAAALEFVKQNIQIRPFEQWYKSEFEGGRPVRTSEPVYILTGMDEKGMGIEHGPQIVLQDDIDDGFLSYGNTGELEGDYDDLF